MKTFRQRLQYGLAALWFTLAPAVTWASSHMDAPLITLDDPANPTDVYAFLTERDGTKYLVTALSVYPFEEPGIGPNNYRFDDNVRYEIHVATGNDVAAGSATVSYRFQFTTEFTNPNTIRQAFLGPIEVVDDAVNPYTNLNMTQRYTVTKIHKGKGKGKGTFLGSGIVPPNNQGLLTFAYNQNGDGEMPAKGGVAAEADLDAYTQRAIATLDNGYRAFAGQRDDGFYADIQSIFDLDLTFAGPNKPFDSQGGFNVHTLALEIPVNELGGDQQVVGVYATTSRRRINVLFKTKDPEAFGSFIQVGRQGNPLFNEALVQLADKDLYNRTSPTQDAELFRQYALAPELAAFLVPLLGLPENLLTNRTDLAQIFIPDLIKTDLSTAPARLAGAPDDLGFSRLGVFGGDTLVSTVQPGLPLPNAPAGTIPGGWPNGRRFGDDVVDAAVTAVISDLRGDTLIINGPAGDFVDNNDITYNKVFPYAATPLNGRNHGHHTP